MRVKRLFDTNCNKDGDDGDLEDKPGMEHQGALIRKRNGEEKWFWCSVSSDNLGVWRRLERDLMVGGLDRRRRFSCSPSLRTLACLSLLVVVVRNKNQLLKVYNFGS
jgi:hypothetical protein